MAAPTFVDQDSDTWSNASAQRTLTVSGAQAGDILVVHAACRESATITMDTAGFSLISHTSSSGNTGGGSNGQVRNYLWMKVYGSETQVQVTPSGNTYGYAHLFIVRGADTTGMPAVLNEGSSGAFNTTPNVNGLTPDAADSLVVAGVGTGSGLTSAAATLTPTTAGFAEVYDHGGVIRVSAAAVTKTHDTTATGSIAWSSDDATNQRFSGFSVSFRPAGGGGGATPARLSLLGVGR